MLIPLGFWAASAGGGAAAGTFELIEQRVLDTAESSVTFSSLSSYSADYQHFQLRIATRTNRTGAESDPIILRFNADEGSNYARHGLLGYNFGGSSAMQSNAAASQTSLFLTEAMPVASSATSAFGAIVADILDPYETTKYTTVRSLAGMNATWSSIELRSGLWMNTNAISSIELKPLAGTLLSIGSRFSLYGIRGA